MTDADKLYVLRAASTSFGFMPQTAAIADACGGIEMSRLIAPSNRDPVWFITDGGREELARLEAS